MNLLADGSYAIDDILSIPGEGVTPFIFGRGWLLEVVEIQSGEFYFLQDEAKVEPVGNRFGIFYPRFCFVRSCTRDVKGRVRGVGNVEPLADLPIQPILFDTDFDEIFRSSADAIAVIRSARNIRSIEPNPRPSRLSIRTKQLIDENYQAFPSISRIANRLRVSHAHLTRQFRKDFRMSPSEYLHHLRVAEATFRLSIGEPITDISFDVGYNDLSRFYKQFRKATRTSPAVCRKQVLR